MLGHKMFQILSAEYRDVWGSMRSRTSDPALASVELLQTDRIVSGLDAVDWPSIRRAINDLRPDVVINCVGVIKQRAEAHSAIPSIAVNSLLPHLLARELENWGGRLIHISSDCVFSGSRGNYSEDDTSDADDLYGRSKFLGEVSAKNSVTLRTSIIGRELTHHNSLLDWFLQQNHRTLSGYTNALWSGVSTLHLSHLVGRIIREHPNLNGLYHVSSGRMSKYELLLLFQQAYALDIHIDPDSTVSCDRSLNGSRLASAIGYVPPSWEQMMHDLIADQTPYHRWTRLGAIH